MAQQEQTQASVDPSQYPPLTQWKNEPTLATLRGDLEVVLLRGQIDADRALMSKE